jgi:membrane-associated phospholipid phosphatase
MEYHLGRYLPPPAAPALPRALVDGVRLPGVHTATSMRVSPPAADALRRAELPLVREAIASRTELGDRWAAYMDRRGATSMWWGAAQRARSASGGVVGAYRSAELRTALVAGQVVGLAATYWPGQLHRGVQRPFQLDESIRLLGITPRSSSYPSGHARHAFTSARIAARLDPAQADLAYDLAGQVARSRVYAGAHLPSDVEAGARLGTAVGDAIVGAVKTARVAVPLAAAAGGAALLWHERHDED